VDAWMIIARALNLLDYPHWILTRDDITRAYIAKQHEMNIAYPVANTLKHVHATRLQQAQSTLTQALAGHSSIDLKPRRDLCLQNVAQWVEDLHATLCRGQAAMITAHKQKSTNMKDGTGHLVDAWRRWQALLKLPSIVVQDGGWPEARGL
jgi:hypothetical protein